MVRSFVLTDILHIDDSGLGCPVGDSVGHPTSVFFFRGSGDNGKEDGGVRPKSVDLLQDCRVINSRAPGRSRRGWPLSAQRR